MGDPEKLPAYDIRDVKILIVDGNKHMRHLLKQILHVFAVRNLREADDALTGFKEFKEFKPDIVLTEWELTPMDGADFVRMIRRAEDSPNPMASIIMITAYTEATVVATARDCGINEFLAKPISPNRLYRRIAALIDRPRPFIRSKTYVGPCRHRRKIDDYDGPRRRESDADDIFVID
ncbi:MAG: response regulator [Magnetospirillum sp. WYHS-4]